MALGVQPLSDDANETLAMHQSITLPGRLVLTALTALAAIAFTWHFVATFLYVAPANPISLPTLGTCG